MNIFDLIKHEINKTGELPPYLPVGYRMIHSDAGVSIQAQNRVLRAHVVAGDSARPIAGLKSPPPYSCELINGKINGRFIDLALKAMAQHAPAEVNLQIVWEDKRYKLKFNQAGTSSAVSDYDDVPGNVVMDLHSHPTFDAYFSGTDRQYAKGFRLYGVIGRIKSLKPEMVMMLGVHGYHVTINANDIFFPLPLVPILDADVETGFDYDTFDYDKPLDKEEASTVFKNIFDYGVPPEGYKWGR